MPRPGNRLTEFRPCRIPSPGLALLPAVLVLVLFCTPARARVVLSEVMYDPPGADHHDEYVELVNTDAAAGVDLSGWCLGDGEEIDLLLDGGGGMVLGPGQFALVLDGSYSAASTTYESVRTKALLLTIDDKAFGRGGWSNSREETVVLCNARGDTVEVFRYQPAARPGFSWEKVDPQAGSTAANWALTLIEGGTPGRLNSVDEKLRPAAGGIAIAAEPNPFVQTVVLSYRLPAAPALVNLWIYDMEGFRLRSLMQGAPAAGRGEVVWDGRDRDGRVVAPGIYIVYMEASAQGVVTRARKVVVRRMR